MGRSYVGLILVVEVVLIQKMKCSSYDAVENSTLVKL
jgi:hypothetical protein